MMSTGCWWQPGASADRSGYNAIETELAVGTVADLNEAWSRYGVVSPVIVGNTVYTAGGGTWANRVDTGEEVWFSDAADASGTFFDGTHLIFRYGYGDRSSAVEADRRTGANVPDGQRFGGRLDAVRGSTQAGQLIADPMDPWGRHQLRVEDDENPDRNWDLVLVDSRSIDQPVTVGAEDVFVAGRGRVSANPSSAEMGLSLRAYALDGNTHVSCAPFPNQGFPIPAVCPRFAVPLAGTWASSPVLSGQTVFVATDAGVLSAVDIVTGAVSWTATLGSPATAAPVVGEGVVMVPTEGAGLVAFPAAGCGMSECLPQWLTSTAASIDLQPAAAGGVVFVSAADGTIEAFAIAGCGAAVCEPLWGRDLGAASTDAPVIGSAHLFVIVDGMMHVFTPSTL